MYRKFFSQYDSTIESTPLFRSRRNLYYLFDITEFRYKESYFNGLEVLGENIHFDISGYFVISEFDIEGVNCISIITAYYMTTIAFQIFALHMTNWKILIQLGDNYEVNTSQ